MSWLQRRVKIEAALSADDASDILPVGNVVLGDLAQDGHEHDWGPEQSFIQPDRTIVMRGCNGCPAILRVNPAPEDLHDLDALEGWLNS